MLQLQIKKTIGAFDVDLDIASTHRVLGLFGPTGSGKTTLLNCIAGILNPDEGRISLDDRVYFDSRAHTNVPIRQRRIGYVFQDGLLFDHYSVRKNLEYGLKAGSTGPSFDEVVECLSIDELLDRMPATLSGGQKRLVAVGRALLSNPSLLLFDEPLTGLDAVLAGRVIVSLKRVLRQFQIAAIYVSHSISDVIYFCDEAVVLQAGRIIAQGPPRSVITRPEVLEERHLEELRNVFTADIVSFDEPGHSLTLRIGSNHLTVYHRPALGETQATIAIRASDIILSAERITAISARNILSGRVTRVERLATRLLVFVDVGVEWMVEIGEAAKKELDLKPGREIFAIVKASAIALL